MKQFIFLLFFTFPTLSGICQKNDSLVDHHGKNSITLELFGNAGLYSVNYERLIFHKKSNYITARLGFGYFGADAMGSELIYTVPVMINYFHPLYKYFFIEAGAGVLAGDVKNYNEIKQSANPKIIGMATSFGIRCYPGKRFFFKMDATPFFFSVFNPSVYFFGGLSAGYDFK